MRVSRWSTITFLLALASAVAVWARSQDHAPSDPHGARIVGIDKVCEGGRLVGAKITIWTPPSPEEAQHDLTLKWDPEKICGEGKP